MMLRYVMTAAATIAVLSGCSQADEGSAAEPDGDSSQNHGSHDPPPDGAGGQIDPADYQNIRWEPLPKYTNGKQTKTYLRFLDDGTWTGSDGCNGQSGHYTIAGSGRLTADPNPQTLIACPGANVNVALDTSDHIAVKGDHLILYDGQKAVLEFAQ
jgi:heat shock protein HslJ